MTTTYDVLRLLRSTDDLLDETLANVPRQLTGAIQSRSSSSGSASLSAASASSTAAAAAAHPCASSMSPPELASLVDCVLEFLLFSSSVDAPGGPLGEASRGSPGGDRAAVLSQCQRWALDNLLSLFDDDCREGANHGPADLMLQQLGCAEADKRAHVIAETARTIGGQLEVLCAAASSNPSAQCAPSASSASSASSSSIAPFASDGSLQGLIHRVAELVAPLVTGPRSSIAGTGTKGTKGGEGHCADTGVTDTRSLWPLVNSLLRCRPCPPPPQLTMPMPMSMPMSMSSSMSQTPSPSAATQRPPLIPPPPPMLYTPRGGIPPPPLTPYSPVLPASFTRAVASSFVARDGVDPGANLGASTRQATMEAVNAANAVTAGTAGTAGTAANGVNTVETAKLTEMMNMVDTAFMLSHPSAWEMRVLACVLEALDRPFAPPEHRRASLLLQRGVDAIRLHSGHHGEHTGHTRHSGQGGTTGQIGHAGQVGRAGGHTGQHNHSIGDAPHLLQHMFAIVHRLHCESPHPAFVELLAAWQRHCDCDDGLGNHNAIGGGGSDGDGGDGNVSDDRRGDLGTRGGHSGGGAALAPSPPVSLFLGGRRLQTLLCLLRSSSECGSSSSFPSSSPSLTRGGDAKGEGRRFEKTLRSLCEERDRLSLHPQPEEGISSGECKDNGNEDSDGKRRSNEPSMGPMGPMGPRARHVWLACCHYPRWFESSLARLVSRRRQRGGVARGGVASIASSSLGGDSHPPPPAPLEAPSPPLDYVSWFAAGVATAPRVGGAGGGGQRPPGVSYGAARVHIQEWLVTMIDAIHGVLEGKGESAMDILLQLAPGRREGAGAGHGGGGGEGVEAVEAGGADKAGGVDAAMNNAAASSSSTVVRVSNGNGNENGNGNGVGTATTAAKRWLWGPLLSASLTTSGAWGGDEAAASDSGGGSTGGVGGVGGGSHDGHQPTSPQQQVQLSVSTVRRVVQSIMCVSQFVVHAGSSGAADVTAGAEDEEDEEGDMEEVGEKEQAREKEKAVGRGGDGVCEFPLCPFAASRWVRELLRWIKDVDGAEGEEGEDSEEMGGVKEGKGLRRVQGFAVDATLDLLRSSAVAVAHVVDVGEQMRRLCVAAKARGVVVTSLAVRPAYDEVGGGGEERGDSRHGGGGASGDESGGGDSSDGAAMGGGESGGTKRSRPGQGDPGDEKAGGGKARKSRR